MIVLSQWSKQDITCNQDKWSLLTDIPSVTSPLFYKSGDDLLTEIQIKPHHWSCSLRSRHFQKLRQREWNWKGMENKTYTKETKLSPHPFLLLPNFLLAPSRLLRSPSFSLACLISTWKRKGNSCYTGYRSHTNNCT